MEYNSDYSVRLATLEALGGDVTKCYDSVYAIDLAILDAIEHGGGGEGMNYDQIKAALASSGVTEIVVNGDGESITLNYDLLNQIGQGGMDYDDVKAALAASGLTSILVLDGSGHTKEMDYALLDQIGEVDFSKVQSGLTNTGVTDILFDNGSGSTKVLDYDLVNQIGQGGGGSGDYLVVDSDSVDALSGITSPKDGMMAYVQKQPEQALRQVIVFTNTNSSDSITFNYLNDSTNYILQFSIWSATVKSDNAKIRGDLGYTNVNGQNNIQHADLLSPIYPIEIIFNNGAKANLISCVNSNNNFVYTLYVEKFNDAFPSISFYGGTSTSVTEETVTVTYNPKGIYRYDGGLNKWVGYHIYPTFLSQDELNDVMSDTKTNKIPLKIYLYTTSLPSTYSWVSLDRDGYNPYGSDIYFGSSVANDFNGIFYYNAKYNLNSTNYRIQSSNVKITYLSEKDKNKEYSFSKVQSGLTNTGVTSILFVDGNNTKTVNYDVANHIPNKYIVVMTESEYEALTTKDENTIYYLTSD